MCSSKKQIKFRQDFLDKVRHEIWTNMQRKHSFKKILIQKLQKQEKQIKSTKKVNINHEIIFKLYKKIYLTGRTKKKFNIDGLYTKLFFFNSCV